MSMSMSMSTLCLCLCQWLTCLSSSNCPLEVPRMCAVDPVNFPRDDRGALSPESLASCRQAQGMLQSSWCWGLCWRDHFLGQPIAMTAGGSSCQVSTVLFEAYIKIRVEFWCADQQAASTTEGHKTTEEGNSPPSLSCLFMQLVGHRQLKWTMVGLVPFWQIVWQIVTPLYWWMNRAVSWLTSH